MMTKQLTSAYWALRIGLGGMAFLAGLDKYFNLLANWPDYVSPLATAVLPLSAAALMHVVGVVEIAVGLAILAGWTRLGAYVASVWLLGIAANLVTTGRFFDVAVRDVMISIGAYTLARLAEAREPAPVAHGVRTDREAARSRATA